MKIILLLSLHVLIVNAQNVTKTMLRLPDTGQTTSYTATFGEDNDFLINMPYFQINGNGTVTDTITGLMWQQTDGGEMTIENARIYCNNLTLGGYSDWRLPTAHEAFSILNHQNTNPAINTTVFTSTLAEYWWTSTRQANDSNKIWVTNAGGGIGNHLKTETISAGGTKKIHARAVREPLPLQLISNQYNDNGNGTISDSLTGLVWQKVPYSDTLTWEQSLQYADTLSLSGFSDWRLPNIKELQSINDEKRVSPSINNTIFSCGNPKKYWSSTTLPNQTTKAWYLNTQYGITTYDNKTIKHYLICVRGNSFLATSSPVLMNEEGKMKVGPNPFKSKIYFNDINLEEAVELINSNGVVVYRGTSIDTHDFSALPCGIYLLKMLSKPESTIKLIKE